MIPISVAWVSELTVGATLHLSSVPRLPRSIIVKVLKCVQFASVNTLAFITLVVVNYPAPCQRHGWFQKQSRLRNAFGDKRGFQRDPWRQWRRSCRVERRRAGAGK